MIARERAREFAILRVMGASRKMVSRLLLTESAVVSLAGAVLGLVVGALVVFPFSRAISGSLGMPYLTPGAGKVAAMAGGSLLLAVLAGSMTGAAAAWRAGKTDAGLLLREGA